MSEKGGGKSFVPEGDLAALMGFDPAGEETATKAKKTATPQASATTNEGGTEAMATKAAPKAKAKAAAPAPKVAAPAPKAKAAPKAAPAPAPKAKAKAKPKDNGADFENEVIKNGELKKDGTVVGQLQKLVGSGIKRGDLIAKAVKVLGGPRGAEVTAGYINGYLSAGLKRGTFKRG